MEENMMIENIEDKLWEMLKKKQVSLAIICDIEGNILWHRGTKIINGSIDEGEGFSKIVIKKLINDKKNRERNESREILANGLSNTERTLHLKTNIVLPINEDFFLYIESDIRELFSESDTTVFKMVGELLEEIIDGIKKKKMISKGSLEAVKKFNGSRRLLLNML
jgi:hypothetical protein